MEVSSYNIRMENEEISENSSMVSNMAWATSNSFNQASGLNDVTTIQSNPYLFDGPLKTYELVLVGGKRIMLDFNWESLTTVEEIDGDDGRRCTHIVLKKGGDYLVNCTLTAFMRLVGRDYVSWSESMMSSAIKGD